MTKVPVEKRSLADASCMPTRVPWMDLARLVAAFFVVTIHVASVPMLNMQTIPMSWWWWANAYESASRPAVPLFVMISGALLLTPQYLSTQRFFRRRAAKVLVPLLGWTLIYDAWRAWRWHEHIGMGELARNLLDGLSTPAYIHLWFLWIIVSLYLLTPIFQPFVTRASAGTQAYFAVLWLFVTSLRRPLEQWSGLHLGLLLEPAFGFVGYYIIGASIHRFVPARLNARQILACVLVYLASVAATAWGTYFLSQAKGSIDESLMNPLSGTVVLMSLSAFLLIRHFGSQWLEADLSQSAAWRARLTWASALSFGIYLSHPLILDLLDLVPGLSRNPPQYNTAWYVPFMATLALVAAGILTALLRVVPGLRRLVP